METEAEPNSPNRVYIAVLLNMESIYFHDHDPLKKEEKKNIRPKIEVRDLDLMDFRNDDDDFNFYKISKYCKYTKKKGSPSSSSDERQHPQRPTDKWRLNGIIEIPYRHE